MNEIIQIKILLANLSNNIKLILDDNDKLRKEIENLKKEKEKEKEKEIEK